jgi:hypothetical protein
VDVTQDEVRNWLKEKRAELNIRNASDFGESERQEMTKKVVAVYDEMAQKIRERGKSA